MPTRVVCPVRSAMVSLPRLFTGTSSILLSSMVYSTHQNMCDGRIRYQQIRPPNPTALRTQRESYREHTTAARAIATFLTVHSHKHPSHCLTAPFTTERWQCMPTDDGRSQQAPRDTKTRRRGSNPTLRLFRKVENAGA